MLRIDHFCMCVRHLYAGAARFRDETGLDNYDGGWFLDLGIAQRTVPIGNDNYIEIESVIDHSMALQNPFGFWFESVLGLGSERFMGWVLRVDTMGELEAAAARMNSNVGRTWGRIRPDGRRNAAYIAPGTGAHPWPKGLPNVMLWDDMNDHPDRIAKVAHRVTPRGISWLEVGCEAKLKDWLGPEVDSLPLRYVDGPPGLYGVGIATDGGEVAIRRPPVPNTTNY